MAQLANDARFATNADRTANHAELEPLLMSHFAAQPRRYWLERLQAANVPSAPIATVDEVARNPQLIQRQMILHADHPGFDGLIVPGSPLKTAGVVEAPATHSPSLGEDTETVLGRLLGYDSTRLNELRKLGVV